MIRKARLEDLDEILEVLKGTVENFKNLGIDQWQNGYPNREVFTKDIEKEVLYVYTLDGEILGFMAYIKCNDPLYLALDTYKSNHSVVIHRISVKRTSLKKGIASKMFSYVIEDAESKGFDSVKIDTHKDNFKMLALLKKLGFEYRGYLKSINREAFELVINEEGEKGCM